MSTVGPDLPPLSPTREEFRAPASQGNLIPIFAGLAADLDAPLSAFLHLRYSPCAFLLEVTGCRSLAVLEHDFPGDLEISSWAGDGEIMGDRHRRFNFLRPAPVPATA